MEEDKIFVQMPIGVGEGDDGAPVVMIGPVLIRLTQEQGVLLRNGLCLAFGIPVLEEIEAYEQSGEEFIIPGDRQ
jgi:hypothetical protein